MSEAFTALMKQRATEAHAAGDIDQVYAIAMAAMSDFDLAAAEYDRLERAAS